ncbi:MAG: hypothetical protein H0U26_04970 [Acidimicrobiia bacterium]|nr:hypothetical protein [Acidimicrobiia bacterium]
MVTHDDLVEDELTDDELAALALAADPDAPPAEGAVPVWDLLGSGSEALLPGWYMPTPMTGAPLLQGWRRRVALLIVVSFLAIVSYGLCSTYGQVVPA